MSMKKSLYDISEQITEEEYRNNGKIHYSTLSTFASGGPHIIPNLYDKKESPSLLFGSMVDTMLTEGIDAYRAKYFIGNFPKISDDIANLVKGIYNIYSPQYIELKDVPSNIIIASMNELGIYQNNWKEETKIDKILKAGSEYYKLLAESKDKTLVTAEDHMKAIACVETLKTSPSTSFLFAENNSIDNVERHYQLKFSHRFDGLDYAAMFDEIVVFHDTKTILPIDLKTTSSAVDEFYNHFIKWNYQIQARQYWRILRAIMDEDEYFKDFKLLNVHFVVINKETLLPLVWEYRDSAAYGDLEYGDNIIVRDPFNLAKDLMYYLDNNLAIDREININKPNDIVYFLNKNRKQ